MASYWVAGDWGTTRLRVFKIVEGQVVDRREGRGVGALNGALEPALREALAPWRREGEPGEIRLCGMVGSRNGWVSGRWMNQGSRPPSSAFFVHS